MPIQNTFYNSQQTSAEKNFCSSCNPAFPRSVQSLILERGPAVVIPSAAHFATFSPRSLLAVLLIGSSQAPVTGEKSSASTVAN
jgi:hypothetical protein